MTNKKILCLFDVDGTLTKARQKIDHNFENFLLKEIKPLSDVGLVGGSDLNKVIEQMSEDVIHRYNYVFPENGLVAYKAGRLIHHQSIQEFIGEEKLQTFINFVLKYLSQITLPVKRGTFVEFRSGMLNISPVGRSCSQKERDDFEKYDSVHKVRATMIEAIKKEFPNFGLTYSIGGQISFDVFPNGWDKTYCLRHLENEGYAEIHFFGDKTDYGGNDYEIFNHPRTIGHKVLNPDDTKNQLSQLFLLQV
ncbi:hypothetical protein RN001_014145 [Aquatica leii]|uniref:Phosphomannomutase n=1 Tax=Aquatica leii TaxID=1421715 RepID=A0AAN7SP00_9COLE|nr:hypothetical protein RN001_014145 [Aquatica leii]